MNDFNEFVKNDISDAYTKKILIYELFSNVLTKPSDNFQQNISEYKSSIYNRYKTKYGTEDNCYFNELSSYIGIINELNDNLTYNDFVNIDHNNFIVNFNNLYDLSEMSLDFKNASQSNEFVSFMEKFKFPLNFIFDNIKHTFNSSEDTLLHLIKKVVDNEIPHLHYPSNERKTYQLSDNKYEQINYIIQNNLDIIRYFKQKTSSHIKKTYINNKNLCCINEKYDYITIYFNYLLNDNLTLIYKFIDIDTPNDLIKVLYEKYKKYIKIDVIKSIIKSIFYPFPYIYNITTYKLYNKINLINELMPELLDYILELISSTSSTSTDTSTLKEKFQIPEIEFYIKYIKNENKINNK